MNKLREIQRHSSNLYESIFRFFKHFSFKYDHQMAEQNEKTKSIVPLKFACQIITTNIENI